MREKAGGPDCYSVARCRGGRPSWGYSLSLALGIRPPETPLKLVKTFRAAPAVGFPGPIPQGPRE